MKWRIFFLNIDKLSELWMAGSSLFHSEIVEGKKVFEKTMFYTENGNAVYISRGMRWVLDRN